MKNIIYIITICILFYSCDTSTSPQRNPIGYLSEDAYFITDPYIPYPNIKNRIDIGQISYPELSSQDSNFIRAMFYDNSVLFKNAGDLYVNNILIDKLRVDKILKIKVIFEDIINFGPGYYSELDEQFLSDSITIESTGTSEVPMFNYKIKPVQKDFHVINLDELKTVDIEKGFQVELDTIHYDNYRIKLFNDNSNRVEYFIEPQQNILYFSPERLTRINSGSFNLEITGGDYLLDSLNEEYLIINNFISKRYVIELK